MDCLRTVSLGPAAAAQERRRKRGDATAELTGKSKCHDTTRFAANFGRTRRPFQRNQEAYQEDEQIVSRLEVPWRRIMTNKNEPQSSQNARRDEPKLDSRYGEIGISAVAAALQYASTPKTEAKTDAKEDAPVADAAVVREPDNWLAGIAA
jgi:hypothetical protein